MRSFEPQFQAKSTKFAQIIVQFDLYLTSIDLNFDHISWFISDQELFEPFWVTKETKALDILEHNFWKIMNIHEWNLFKKFQNERITSPNYLPRYRPVFSLWSSVRSYVLGWKSSYFWIFICHQINITNSLWIYYQYHEHTSFLVILIIFYFIEVQMGDVTFDISGLWLT